ncbi:MAG: dihydropteroate synthase [Blastocatellia bacterium]|nr:dihydropteroate synthase [Blastocatellia bacterium]MCS7156321.1 dihydropteroate synthase [Blastocatellia bacterium]MCX7751328.1 dihydropteroate synthase [Blastocatellia bacterium]MDW8169041.1 dihydropteroate synthase [Acidobacteriota bacterium]MDW8256401.1 dihydropteroate synthase [Acidobacteriota bacterium]
MQGVHHRPTAKRQAYRLILRDRVLELGTRTLLMGILNVTPDSFSDGGEFFSLERAVERALEIEAEGADILDIGGESTRPGAKPVPVEEEYRRVLPVLERLQGRLRIPISIDTTKYEVARAALEAGAALINDVSGLRRDERLADLAAEFGAALVLMHSRGTPETMQQLPPSSDILREISDYFAWALARAQARGVAAEQILLDPGLGFGKTIEDNLLILNRLDTFAQFGRPLLVGPSRKSFIGHLTGRAPRERAFGTAAAVVAAIFRGAHIVRVHDVREMRDVIRVADAILHSEESWALSEPAR